MKKFESAERKVSELYNSLIQLTQKACSGAYASIGSMYEKAIDRMTEKVHAVENTAAKTVKTVKAKAARINLAERKNSFVAFVKEKSAKALESVGNAAEKADAAIFGTGSSAPAKRRVAVAAAAVLFVATAAISGVVAYLNDSSAPIKNTFEMGVIGTEIEEDFDYEKKENVKFSNNGDVPVYIRATYVASWKTDEGEIAAETPNFTKTLGTSENWVQGGDGFYYYIVPVEPGDSTDVLIKEISTSETKEGYSFDVVVLSQAIQAEPDEAVLEAWASGVSAVSSGKLTIK